MKVIDNDGITSAMESASFWLNAWTVGIFLTLKLKDYFLKTQKKFFVFYDITTIFDVFNLDPKQLNSLDKNKIQGFVNMFSSIILYLMAHLWK